MKIEKVNINSNEFKYNGTIYNIESAVNKDKKLIIAEANESHKDFFKELYDIDSLSPEYTRLFLNEKDEIIYAMIIYIIKYKKGNTGRYACGNYYPIYKDSTGKNFIMPHPYQASICW